MTNVNVKPLWARFLCLILSFAIVLSCTALTGTHSDAYSSSAINVKLIDWKNEVHTDPAAEFGLTYDFSGLMRNGRLLSEGDELMNGDRLSFVMKWKAGRFDSTYDDEQGRFTLVFDNLKCANVNIENLSEQNVEGTGCLASYIMNPSDGILRIEVTPNGKNNNFEGFCTVGLTVNVDTDLSSSGNTLRLEPITNLTFKYAPGTVTPSKSLMGGIYKSGGKYYQNFSINLTHAGADVSNVKVTDTCGSIFKDLTSSSPTFRVTDASFTDKLPDSGEVVSGTVTGAHSFELNFATLGESKRIVYALEIDPDNVPAALRAAKSGDYSAAANDLSVSYNNGTENRNVTAPTVNLEMSQPYVGKSGWLDRDNSKINWTISFNPGTLGTFIDSDGLVITDTPDGSNLTLADLREGLRAANIVFTEESGALRISGLDQLTNEGWRYALNYSTEVRPGLLDSTTIEYFTNNVSATFGGVTPDPVSAAVPVGKNVEPGTVHKSVNNADPDNFDIEWKSDITIPADGGTTDNIVIEDDSRNTWDATYGNVVIPAYLKNDISGFTFLVDNTAVDMSGYISEIKYREIDKNDQWGTYSEKDTFAANSDVGFKFTLNDSFVTANAGKTLTIIYHTVMGGDLSGNYSEDRKASLKYRNTVKASYRKSDNTTINSPSETAEYQFQADVTAQKLTQDNYDPHIFADYPGGDHPVLAFWEIRVHSEDGFSAGDIITVRDKVSTGHSYYADSAVLVAGGAAVGNQYYMTSNDSWRTKYTGNITNIAVSGTETVFTINVDDTLAAAANANSDKVINLLYATAANDEISSKVIFGKTVTVTNTAEVSVNSETVTGLSATRNLSSDSEVMTKTLDSVVKGDNTSKYGDASYTIVVNKYGQKLSGNGKIIVDDWLGGSLELPDTVTVAKQKLVGGNLQNDGAPIVYTIEKNPAYDSSDDSSIHSFFKKNGVIVPASECAVYKTGVGKKMSFNLDDGTAYKITYSLKYEKLVTALSLSSVEEAARYNNTAVIRVEGGGSSSKTVSINSSNYTVTAGVSAGTMEDYIIFDIRKKWTGDNSGAELPDSITLHVKRTNLDDNSVENSDMVITLNENAVEQEDGSWLFALKLPAVIKEGSRITHYSYTISEVSIAGYVATWSTPLTDVALGSGELGKVVSSELTNTSAMRFGVRKTDISGLDELKGAKLAIYRASDIGTDGRPVASATPADSWVSDGTVHYTSLADGSYVLVETGTYFTDSTTGRTYKVTESTVSFTVNGDYIRNVSGAHTGTITAADKEAGFMLYTAASGDTPAEFRVCDASSETTVITIDKTDMTGTAIPAGNDATFKLTVIDDGITLEGVQVGNTTLGNVTTCTFTGNSTQIKGLKDGSYTLEETVAPDGYLAVSKFGFTVTGGIVSSVSKPSTTGDIIRTPEGNLIIKDAAKVQNDDIPTVKITKTDMSGAAIPASNKASFRLTANGGSTLQGVKLGEEVLGNVTYVDFSGNETSFTGLADGSYTLEETVAPSGYLAVSTFTFTVRDGKVAEITGLFTNGSAEVTADGIKVMDKAITSYNPQPVVTTSPVTTTTPAVTYRPMVTSAPGRTTSPVVTRGPIETSAPGRTTTSAYGPQPVDTTSPADGSQSADTTVPADDSQPADTTMPADDSQPADTTMPADDSQPADTTMPADDSQPADTTVPADSSQPVDTTAPTDGSQPVGTTTSSDLITPTDSTGTNGSVSGSGSDSGSGHASAETTNENPHTGAGMLALALVPETVLLVVFRRRKNK